MSNRARSFLRDLAEDALWTLGILAGMVAWWFVIASGGWR